jgi:hypothetical protein
VIGVRAREFDFVGWRIWGSGTGNGVGTCGQDVHDVCLVVFGGFDVRLCVTFVSDLFTDVDECARATYDFAGCHV